METMPTGTKRSLKSGNWLPIFGLLWALSLWVTITFPRIGLWFAAGLIVLIPVVVLLTRPEARRWVLPSTVFFLLASSLGAIGILSLDLWKYLVIAASAILLASIVTQRRDPDDPFGTRLINLSIALSIFFSWVVLLSFGVGIFLIWPWWWLAIAGGAITGMSAVILWMAGRVPWKRFRFALPLVILVGAEMMVVSWWLPTVIYVGAIVSTTALMLWFQVLRHIWQGNWQSGRGRRYLLVGIGVCSIVLLTARWG